MNKEGIRNFRKNMENRGLSINTLVVWSLINFKASVLNGSAEITEDPNGNKAKITWEGSHSITIISKPNYLDESEKSSPHISVFAGEELTPETGLKINTITTSGKKVSEEKICTWLQEGIIKAYKSYFPEDPSDKIKLAQPKRID